MADEPVITFGELLKQVRRAIPGLTQERLAEEAGLSWREISDLERGVRRRPREDTVHRLASALKLTGRRRTDFETAALGRPAGGAAVIATEEGSAPAGVQFRGSPQEAFSFVVAALDTGGVSAARSAVTEWRGQAPVESAWLSWVDGLVRLAADGRLPPSSRRPLPTAGSGPFLGREQQVTELGEFLNRVRRGRGGLALILGPAGIGKSRLVVEVLTNLLGASQVQWMTFDRGEAGYQGWRRLLAPLWTTLRRTELAPASLLAHAVILDDLLLIASDSKLAGKLYPGEVAAAFAALLIDAALRQPLVLVIDDAHRGGSSSDHLLLEVVRRVNAHGVGVIAALRPDELENDSPLRGYSDQAGGRAAVDMVTLIRVPPLGISATAGLLRERTGVEPPRDIAEQVMRQTGGRPQLINSTQVRAPANGADAVSWAVGRLDAEGLRVLESTIHHRTAPARTVLQAAALSAIQGRIEPDVVAGITDMAADFVERILEDERRHGSILTPQVASYCFQHDNWIDALVSTCPPDQRRSLHARCLGLLRADPSSDVRQLAHHAMGAGAALVGVTDLMTLTRNAADLAMADYAFGAAAELYDVAARHAAGEERIDLMIRQSDAMRLRGGWGEARGALKRAASLARTLGAPGREAAALMHLERLTWSYGLDEKDLTQQIRDVMARLPPEEAVLRAQAQAVLAMRLSITARQYDAEHADLARAALKQLPSVTDPLARADIILGIRHGLQDDVPPGKLLEYDRQLLDIAVKAHSAYHLEEALMSSILDTIRGGQLLELPSAVRQHRNFAEKSAASLAVYSQSLIDAMLALATGNFRAAVQHTTEASRLSEPWGGSMASEALMAQTGWLLYETGQVDGLTEILAGLPEQSVSSLNEPVWSLAAGLIQAEAGSAGPAIRIVREMCVNTADFGNLPHGPSRIGILAAAAMVLGHPVVCDALPAVEARRWGVSIADLLSGHPDELVVAGWPAVLLGSKYRYIGLAHLAAGQPASAAVHLTRAVYENSEFAVLHTRTRFDLARALVRQPASRSEGMTEMKLLARRAAELEMAGLAAQATAELDHCNHSGCNQ